MTDSDERRVQGIKRVNVATLVEICGNQPGIPAFEAQSMDVSGRGMHVKTAYVPNIGDPLICRFENEGHEIVVEGVVAWRREGETGGDFGIEFTALDKSSVDALRALCGVMPGAASPRAESSGAAEPGACASGTKVRLHIDGLGSPMKASVKDGSPRRLHVGSQLQFLKVGRRLEVEDVGLGARRVALIDSVDVLVDPRSQIPELVVALRYEGVADTTPEPSVVDKSRDKSDREGSLRASVSSERGGRSAHPLQQDDLDADDVEAEMLAEQQAAEQARLAYDRLGDAAQGAAKVAKATGKTLARVGQSAAFGASRLLKGAGKQLWQLKESGKPAPKRQTALPYFGTRAGQLGKLRPQGSSAHARAQSEVPPSGGAAKARGPVRKRGLKLPLVALGVTMIGATAAYALRDVDGPAVAEQLPLPAQSAVAAAPAAPAPAPQKPTAAVEQRAGGVVANVPLFGPTPMATMEPVALGAPAETNEGETEEAAEKAAAAAAVPDATWGESASSGSGSGSSSTSAAPAADVKPWGRGSMHLPTIHKLRLDAPGAALSGAVSPTGFTVVIPGRKVMESGRAIQRRDSRIAQIKTSNHESGAQVTFQFRGTVPAYRVRLKKDFAEFLISAPEGTNAKH